MIKKIHDKANYLLIIILSIVLKTYYQNEFFYNGIKYLTSTRTMDLMFSILFTFLTFKIYIDKYYYIVLNRYNIITRLKKNNKEDIMNHEIRTKQTSSTSIKTEYTYLPNKPTSYKKTTVKGSKGYKVRTYKDYYLGDTLVKTDDLGLSVYNMFPKKVEVGMIEEDSSSSSEPAG